VSLYPSTTRPFDAPEFIFTQRHRHPTRGHGFCPRVLYSLNPPFWPISGTLQLPVSWCYIFLPPPETRTRNWFPIPFRRLLCPLSGSKSIFPFLYSLSLSCYPIMPTSSGTYSTRSAGRKTPRFGVSFSDPIGPSGDVHPAETDPVPPEQLPFSLGRS
jgi:hypothetical protein